MTALLELPAPVVEQTVTRDGRPATRTIFSENEMLVVTDATASLLRREKKQGVSKSGKTWERWARSSSVFCSYKSGKLRIYERVPGNRRHPGASWRDRTSDWPTPDQPYFAPGAHALFDATQALHPEGVRAYTYQKLAFPLLREAPNTWSPISGITLGLRESTLPDFIRVEFGKTRYRKDLARAIAGSQNLMVTARASALRGLVPTDWLVEMIESRAPKRKSTLMFGTSPDSKEADIRRLFRSLAPHTAHQLMKTWDTASGYDVKDGIYMGAAVLGAMPDTNLKFKDWHSLHEWANREFAKIESENEAIPQGSVAKKLDGKLAGDLSIVSAKQTWDLVEWGSAMSNCIGSYQSQAMQKSCYLFGVYRGSEMVANMEITPAGRINQLFGKFNRRIEANEEEAVYAVVNRELKKDNETGQGWAW